jgi:hypothetical protein
MKKILIPIAGLLLATAVSSQAALASYWSFTNYNGAASLSANAGSGMLSVTAGTPAGGTGTAVNQIAGYDTTPGSAMSLPNPDKATYSFVLAISRNNLTDFVVSYAYNAGASTHSQQWAWSTDGVTYTSFGGVITGQTGWQTATVDFSSVTAIESVANIWFRDSITSGNSGNNPIAFDNIQINAVPEPTTWAMIGFSVIFVGTGAVRQCRRFSTAP